MIALPMRREYGHDRCNGGLFRHGDEEKSVEGGRLMCVEQQFRTYSAAVNYLDEARKSLRRCQYQNVLTGTNREMKTALISKKASTRLRSRIE